MLRAALVTGSAIVFAIGAEAQTLTPTQTAIAPGATQYAYGHLIQLSVTVQYAGPACPASVPYPQMEGQVTLKRDGVVVADSGEFSSGGIDRRCSGGIWTADTVFTLSDVDFGQATYTAEYSGPPSLASSVSSPVQISVAPTATAQVSGSSMLLKVGASTPDPNLLGGFYCSANAFQAAPAPDVAPPAGLHLVEGAVHYDFSSCSYGCGWECPPGQPAFPLQRMLLEMPQDIPAHASVWLYSASVGLAAPTWRRLQSASIYGARAKFFISGNDGDTAMHGWIALATDDASTPVAYQDQWWAGPTESGWGLHLGQTGDRLFMGLYAYRDNGAPTWVVMPGGTWDAAHQVFSGSLYGPLGSPFQHYDASMFRPGAPVGSARIRFASGSAATLDYTIGSVSATKSIQRLAFGTTASHPQGMYAGLWWGGMAKNGWGLSIGHQDNTLFAVWYTYDASGAPTWFVMPGSVYNGAEGATNFDAGELYTGKLYRTSGPPWLGVPFDASKVVVTPAGSLSLYFAPGGDVGQMTWTVDGQSGRETIYRQPF